MDIQTGEPEPLNESADFSAIFSSAEPEPGEPLDADAEALLQDVPESIGGTGGEGATEDEGSAPLFADNQAGSLLPSMQFSEDFVRDAMEEGFEKLAEFFDSAHWSLTERQSRMLAGPTTQLLSSVYAKLNTILPSFLAEWCESTPGMTAFLMAFGFVVAPKIAQQMALTRQRRAGNAPEKRSRPTGVVDPKKPGPRPVSSSPFAVGPIEDTSEPMQMEADDNAAE